MKKASWLVLVLILAAFTFGLSHLFRLRFELGDVYPEYSSLRADPLGCKAFFESLGQLRAAQRNFEPLANLHVGEPVTLFYLGADPEELQFSRDEFETLESFVRTGGRLVISLRPVYHPIRFRFFNNPRGPGGQPRGRNQQDKRSHTTEHVTNRWGLSFQYNSLLKDAEGVYQPDLAFRTDTTTPSPRVLPVRTALWFTNATDSWSVVYARTNDQPVLLERRWGAGSVVMYADSYALSNQALLLERQPALLAWLAGNSPQFLFDETHLGVQSTPGVAMLLRKYHLHGFLLFLLLLAAIYIWKNALPFLPLPHTTQQPDADGFVAGRESAAGFINLLRRNIPAANLLTTCLEQWQNQASPAMKPSRQRLEKMQALIDAENALPPRRRNSVRLYNEFARILSTTAHRSKTHS